MMFIVWPANSSSRGVAAALNQVVSTAMPAAGQPLGPILSSPATSQPEP